VKQFTDVDDLNPLVDFEELECDGDILQLLVTESRSFVVLAEALSAQYLDQGDETQTIGQVRGQVSDVLIDCLEMLVRPACEAILLDQFPLRVPGQIPLLRVHRFQPIHD